MSDLVLLFVTVPVITGVIGWITNWAAVKMIFRPKQFLGIGPLGWQGIVYRHADKFATGVADLANKNLLTARELFERIDPDELDRLLASTLDAEAAAMCEEAAEIIRPGAWAGLPEHVRGMIIAQVKTKTREVSRAVLAEMGGKADEIVDLHELIFTQLSGDNADRLAEFTNQIGHKEFKFIEYSGGIFGFLIGLAQIGAWSWLQDWWLMPVVGAIVGLVTNWLAIQMIFRPQEPKRYFGFFTYQGLFARRQPEIARDYGHVAGTELLTPRNLLGFVTNGVNGERLASMVSDTISARIDEEWAKVKPMIPVEVTADALAAIKAAIVRRLVAVAPAVQPVVEDYLAKTLGVAQTVESRLGNLPKADFERVLRGIFEEDEMTLILVGGFLGAAVGVVQGMLLLTF